MKYDEDFMTAPLVERHYVLPHSTQNLSGVAQEIDEVGYRRVEHMTATLGRSYERSVGTVQDITRYYVFDGSNVFLSHGLVQVGKARTADNEGGFPMIRLFANSIEEM